MTDIAIVLVILINMVTIWITYQANKKQKKIEEFLMRQIAEKERIKQLIKEKDGNVVLQSALVTSDMTFTYVGSMDNPVKKELKDGCIASKDRELYLYKDDKWYMILNDLPQIDYRINYYDRQH